jgi:hypothetical protein
VVYSRIFFVYSSSIGWFGSRPGRAADSSGATTAGVSWVPLLCAAAGMAAAQRRRGTDSRVTPHECEKGQRNDAAQ